MLEASYTKGNCFHDREKIHAMLKLRLLRNTVLSLIANSQLVTGICMNPLIALRQYTLELPAFLMKLAIQLYQLSFLEIQLRNKESCDAAI